MPVLNCTVPITSPWIRCQGTKGSSDTIDENLYYISCDQQFTELSSHLRNDGNCTTQLGISSFDESYYLPSLDSSNNNSGYYNTLVGLNSPQVTAFIDDSNNTGDPSASLNPEMYAMTFITFFTLVAISYFSGMGIRTILRFIR